MKWFRTVIQVDKINSHEELSALLQVMAVDISSVSPHPVCTHPQCAMEFHCCNLEIADIRKISWR